MGLCPRSTGGGKQGKTGFPQKAQHAEKAGVSQRRENVGAQVWVGRSMMKQQAVSTSTLMRGWRGRRSGRQERQSVRAAAGNCGDALVALTGTKVVSSNLTGVMQGLLPCTAVRNWGPRLSAGVPDMDGRACRGTIIEFGGAWAPGVLRCRSGRRWGPICSSRLLRQLRGLHHRRRQGLQRRRRCPPAPPGSSGMAESSGCSMSFECCGWPASSAASVSPTH